MNAVQLVLVGVGAGAAAVSTIVAWLRHRESRHLLKATVRAWHQMHPQPIRRLEEYLGALIDRWEVHGLANMTGDVPAEVRNQLARVQQLTNVFPTRDLLLARGVVEIRIENSGNTRADDVAVKVSEHPIWYSLRRGSSDPEEGAASSGVVQVGTILPGDGVHVRVWCRYYDQFLVNDVQVVQSAGRCRIERLKG